MLTDFVVHNLNRDSGASLFLFRFPIGPQLEDWKAECMFGGWCWLSAVGHQFSLHVVSPHRLIWVFSQYGENQTEAISTLMIKPQKSYSIISPAFYSLSKSKSHPGSRKREIDSVSWWRMAWFWKATWTANTVVTILKISLQHMVC